MIRPRVCIGFLLLIVVTISIPLCTAQEDDTDSSCIILAKPGETYEPELTGKTSDSRHNVTFSFDYQAEYNDRLDVQNPYNKEDIDSSLGVHNIIIDSAVLCTIDFEGTENVLLSDVRAKLVVTSSDYYVLLFGIQIEQESIQYDIPVAFRIVLFLCTLLPFFLLIPDAIEDLQAQLEVDAAAKGVYGQILLVMLPLLSIGLTLLLLGGLDVLG